MAAGPKVSAGSQAGFSLIEALVAAMVGGLLTVSACYFLSAQNGMGLRSADMLKGLNFGKHKMDSLKVSDYDSLAAGSDTLGDRYIRAWRVTRLTDAGGAPTGLKKIELSVYWPLTAEHTVAFTSLLGDKKFKEGE